MIMMKDGMDLSEKELQLESWPATLMYIAFVATLANSDRMLTLLLKVCGVSENVSSAHNFVVILIGFLPFHLRFLSFPYTSFRFVSYLFLSLRFVCLPFVSIPFVSVFCFPYIRAGVTRPCNAVLFAAKLQKGTVGIVAASNVVYYC